MNNAKKGKPSEREDSPYHILTHLFGLLLACSANLALNIVIPFSQESNQLLTEKQRENLVCEKMAE